MIPSHCRECNYPIRPAQVSIAQKPGTRQHRAHGLCKTCYYAARQAGTVPEPAHRRKAEPLVVVPVFDERLAAMALESWLQARRNRLAKQRVLV